jgi:hypothetical protein
MEHRDQRISHPGETAHEDPALAYLERAEPLRAICLVEL